MNSRGLFLCSQTTGGLDFAVPQVDLIFEELDHNYDLGAKSVWNHEAVQWQVFCLVIHCFIILHRYSSMNTGYYSFQILSRNLSK
ncbi:hypothetical protein EYC84_006659 [Monilinia fructicola]|nr:hypothetical protein EYC84_006659 [Monilinia fructicola]